MFFYQTLMKLAAETETRVSCVKFNTKKVFSSKFCRNTLSGIYSDLIWTSEPTLSQQGDKIL